MEAKNAIVYSNTLPEVQANSVQVIQLLQNLVSNGIKYNQSPHPKVIVSHRSDAQGHIISVRDNGIGISPEYHDKVFQNVQAPPHQRGLSRHRNRLGALPKIVSNMGGKIWLDSDYGSGTTIHFSIPKEGVKIEN